MKNAREELLHFLKGMRMVKCANILYYKDGWNEAKHISLKIGYSEEDWHKFFEELDFEFNPYNYELKGILWLDGGTWIEREEYRGSDRWAHFRVPTIPEELQ